MSGGWKRPPASASSRGYGWSHQQQRAALVPLVASGRAMCAEVICLEPSRLIAPDAPWDLAHDVDRTLPARGPAHRRCNENEASRRGGAIAGQQAKRRAALRYRPREQHPGLREAQ